VVQLDSLQRLANSDTKPWYLRESTAGQRCRHITPPRPLHHLTHPEPLTMPTKCRCNSDATCCSHCARPTSCPSLRYIGRSSSWNPLYTKRDAIDQQIISVTSTPGTPSPCNATLYSTTLQRCTLPPCNATLLYHPPTLSCAASCRYSQAIHAVMHDTHAPGGESTGRHVGRAPMLNRRGWQQQQR